jgi:hypothetical protein
MGWKLSSGCLVICETCAEPWVSAPLNSAPGFSAIVARNIAQKATTATAARISSQ